MNGWPDLSTRVTAVRQARGDYRQRWAAVKRLDAQLADTRALAAFDGVIAERFVAPGATASPGALLLRYFNPDSLQILAEVPSRLVLSVREGQSLPFQLE